MMTATLSVRYQFGGFELQPDERRLLSAGAPVPVNPRAFDLLVALVERGGRLSTKDDLLERVWPRTVVEENSLQAQISALRKILGADAIATVARSGYRFTLDVSRAAPQSLAGSLNPHNLPQPSTTFIGREKEIAQIRLLLGRTRLLTLTGTGGCGKTRLAIQVAYCLLETFPDGIWFVELGALADPALVSHSVAAALGLGEKRGKTMGQTIAQHLSATRPLLVLDNAEHLADAVAALVDELLGHCPNAIFLVTSRQPLGVAGETSHRVPSLSVPDPRHDTTPQQLAAFESVQLFVDRARLQRPHFVLTAEIAVALASICLRLDGIPLAIELAAPRLRSMSVDEVNRRLDQRFALLTAGPRTAQHRQRTLRAMIDWSYDLLSEPDQALLCRASVFAGGWTLEAAEHVCVGVGEDPAATLALLDSLVDKNLVQAEEQDGVTRYRMLETVREYAKERLCDVGAPGEWQSRHLDYHLALARRIEPQLQHGDPRPLLQRLETEHDNMRAALAWSACGDAYAAQGLRLAAALSRFWMRRGYTNEALAALERAIASTRSAEATAERARALYAAAFILLSRGGLERARAFVEESLAICRKLGDLHGAAAALSGLGTLAANRGDYAAARAFCEEGLALHEQLGDARQISGALNNLGNVHSSIGEFAAAKALHEKSLAVRRETNDRWAIAGSLLNLALVAGRLGEYADSKTRCEEGLAIWRELGDPRGIAHCKLHLGALANDRGDFAAATAQLVDCLPDMVKLGEHRGIALVLAELAIASARVSGTRAACLWGAAQQLHVTSGSPGTPVEQRRDERQIAAARAAFDDDAAFDAAWQEGRAMTPEQAVHFALAAETAQAGAG